MLSGILAVLVSLAVGSARADCSPAEEGQPTNITCFDSSDPCFDHPLPYESRHLRWYAEYRTVADCFDNRFCDNRYYQLFSADPETKVLTIQNVSRIYPFDMETRWLCRLDFPCHKVRACEKLQVYAKPEDPGCIVIDDTGPNGEKFFNVSCWTSKVYPEAKCKFELSTKYGSYTFLNQTPTYNHTVINGNPVYYSSRCSITVSTEEVGNEPYIFRGNIFPDVDGGENLGQATTVVALGKPESPNCTASVEATLDGDKSVTISCYTSKVFPRAKCKFERLKNANFPIAIKQELTYNHTRISDDPVHYSSRCSVSVSVEELGNEPYIFQAYIYPNLNGGERLGKPMTIMVLSETRDTEPLSFQEISKNEDQSAAITTGVLAAAVIIALIVVIIILVRRNRRSKAILQGKGGTTSATKEKNKFACPEDETDGVEQIKAPSSSRTYENASAPRSVISALPYFLGKPIKSSEVKTTMAFSSGVYDQTSEQNMESAGVYIDMSANGSFAKTSLNAVQDAKMPTKRRREEGKTLTVLHTGEPSKCGRKNPGLYLDLDLDDGLAEDDMEEESVELPQYYFPSSLPPPPIPRKQNKSSPIARLSGKLSRFTKKNMAIYQAKDQPSQATEKSQSTHPVKHTKKDSKRQAKKSANASKNYLNVENLKQQETDDSVAQTNYENVTF